MKNLEILGLKEDQKVIEALHLYLADLHVLYANVRGYHWNVKGAAFFALHAQFEALYNETAEMIDEVAERLLQLSETPENKMEILAKKAKLEAKGHPEEASAMVNSLLVDLQYVIKQSRELVSLAVEAGDDTTNDLIIGFLPGLEKKVWMYNAYRNA